MGERTLPIDAQHREFTVKVDGTAVAREHALISASVVNRANRIASARLVYSDGAADKGEFALANGSVFPPGAQVEVLAGTGASSISIFRGVVVRIGIRAREHAPSQLVVDCRHAVGALSTAPRGANFFDVSDADVVRRLLDGAGVRAKVEDTKGRHAQLVQHDVTDWDFLVARAQANGLAVLTRGADLDVRKPSTSGASVATLQFGATLLDFDSEIDARIQSKEVHALSWSSTDQKLQDVEGDASDFGSAGDLDAGSLAGKGGTARLDLRHGPLAQEEAQALADAHRARARVDQVSGRAKCVGLPQVLPGDVVVLGGVGAHFQGKVFVVGVGHELDQVQGFRTHVQFGGVSPDPQLAQRLSNPRRGPLVASTSGLQYGVVTSLEDPDSEARVRVRLPLVDARDDGVWARISSVAAGKKRGFQFLPEIGDEVVVAFFDDDPRRPVVLGMLHSSAHAAPLSAADTNHHKAFVSRSGIEMHFDDDKVVLTLSTPGGRKLVLDDDAGLLKLEDASGNKLVLGADGITIESSASLTLKAGSGGRFETSEALELRAGTALQLRGTTNAKLDGGSDTVVSGGVVRIN